MTTDLAQYTYGDLVAALRKDLLLDLSTDALPNTFPVVSGLLKWTTPTLINSWTNGGGVAYLKDPLGFVHLRGSLLTAGTTAGTTAFVLPAGFRPGITDFYPALQSGGAASAFVRVGTDGTVQPTYSGQPQIWLNVVTFLAEN